MQRAAPEFEINPLEMSLKLENANLPPRHRFIIHQTSSNKCEICVWFLRLSLNKTAFLTNFIRIWFRLEEFTSAMFYDLNLIYILFTFLFFFFTVRCLFGWSEKKCQRSVRRKRTSFLEVPSFTAFWFSIFSRNYLNQSSLDSPQLA